MKQLTAAAERKPALAKGLHSIGRRGRAEMKRAFETFGTRPRPPGGELGWLPVDWPSRASDAAYTDTHWAWGLFPVEFAAKILLDMLRMTQRLLDSGDPSQAAFVAEGGIGPGGDASDWSDRDAKGPPAPRPFDQVKKDVATIAQYFRSPARPSGMRRPTVRRRVLDNVRAPSTVDVPADTQERLRKLWAQAYRIVDDLTGMRAFEQERWWDPGSEMLLEALAIAVQKRGITDAFSEDLIERLYPNLFGFLDSPQRRDECAALVRRIAQAIHDLHALSLAVVEAMSRNPNRRGSDDEVAHDLLNLTRSLRGDAPHDLQATLFVLCQLEVVQFAFNDHDSLSADTQIELVQISGNGESPLGGGIDAKDKLLGLQLAHFGAFYKKSWRANDWIYGRLGGAERLVRILLSPDRLHRCFRGQSRDAFAAIKAIAVDSCPTRALHEKLKSAWIENGYDASIALELAFLDRADANLPDALHCSANAITMRLHYGILNEELPYLVTAIHADQSDGAEATGPGDVMLRELRVKTAADARDVASRISPDLAQRWLRGGLIARETLLDQAGSDLFTRTVAHTAATLQNTIASKATGLGPVSAFFATLKLPIIGFFLASKGLLAQSRTGAALNGGILVLGTALVLFAFLYEPMQLRSDALPHALVVIGWVLLAYALIVSVLRTPRTFTVVLLAAIAGVGFVVPLAPYLPFVALLVLIFLSVSFTWLQSVVGIVAIAFAAAWGSGWLENRFGSGPPRPDDYRVDVLVFASTVIVTLGWAILQSSSAPRRALESLFRRRFAIPRSKDRTIAACGLRVRIEAGGWLYRDVRSAVVTAVEPGRAASRAKVAVGDSIVAVDGAPVEHMLAATFVERIGAPVPVRLTLMRPATSVERIDALVNPMAIRP